MPELNVNLSILPSTHNLYSDRKKNWWTSLVTMCDFHNFGLIFTGQCTVASMAKINVVWNFFEQRVPKGDPVLWGKQCICSTKMRPKLWKSHIVPVFLEVPPQTKGWPHSFSPPSFIHWQGMLVVTRWNGFWLLHLPPNAGGNTRREPSTKTNEKSIYLKKLQLPPTCMGQTTYFWILMCCTICIWLFFEDIWARIGLMMEQDMFSMCERGIRGGLTFIAKREEKVNKI